MNKISLEGFAADNAPKWVRTKSKNAWGQASIIAEKKALGATLRELAEEYGVTAPTAVSYTHPTLPTNREE